MWIKELELLLEVTVTIIYSTCVCVHTGDLYSTGFKFQKFEELMYVYSIIYTGTQSFITILRVRVAPTLP